MKKVKLYIRLLKSTKAVAFTVTAALLVLVGYCSYQEYYASATTLSIIALNFFILYLVHMPNFAQRLSAPYIHQYGVITKGRIHSEKVVMNRGHETAELKRFLYIQNPNGGVSECSFVAHEDCGIRPSCGGNINLPSG